jgi:hypothetical protein
MRGPSSCRRGRGRLVFLQFLWLEGHASHLVTVNASCLQQPAGTGLWNTKSPHVLGMLLLIRLYLQNWEWKRQRRCSSRVLHLRSSASKVGGKLLSLTGRHPKTKSSNSISILPSEHDASIDFKPLVNVLPSSSLLDDSRLGVFPNIPAQTARAPSLGLLKPT